MLIAVMTFLTLSEDRKTFLVLCLYFVIIIATTGTSGTADTIGTTGTSTAGTSGAAGTI